MSRRAAATGAFLCLVLAASPARAYFEESDIGARSIGFAKAFTAIADDATAVYWNPAGLAWIDKSEAVVVHSRPYGISDLSSNYGAVALPIRPVALGASWHHLGATDVISEDTFTFAAAREIYADADGLRISAGAAVKVARVAFPSYPDPVTFETVDFGSSTKGTFDVGGMVTFPNRITLGGVVQNIGSPEFDLLSGGGGTVLATRSRLGASYRWNPESTISVEYQEVGDNKAVLNMGGEIWFYRAFAIRMGLSDVNAGGGVSIKAKRWLFDMAFLTNGPLGASYRVGLTVPFRK